MCGRFNITTPPEALRALFDYMEQPNFPARYNIAPTQPVPIVHLMNGKRHFRLVRWGFVPSWSKEMPKTVLINARAETIEEKPSFKGAFRHRRCLIPANGFFEWQTRGAAKQPFHIHRRDNEPFAMAGIWEDWLTPDGSELDSCAIVTTAANDSLKHIHHRMPVILPQPEWDEWLGASNARSRDVSPLMRPAANDLLVAEPVSPRVNKAGEEGASLLDPVDPDAESSKSPSKAVKKNDKDQLSLL
ncbi:MAG: SOS response-associated peptidase [Parvibaculum sp.]